ncbi:hypothetical protein Tco_1187452, partial [Tanacetum coccineum]
CLKKTRYAVSGKVDTAYWVGFLGVRVETDIQEKDEKSSKNGQNRAQNGKAWKR